MEIQSAIQSLLTIKTIADGLIAMRDETKVLEVKLSLMQQVFEIRQVLDALQEEGATVKEENRLLKDQIARLQQRDSQLQGYELFEPIPGVFVQAAKPVDGTRPKPPYLCQTCYDNGTKSVLNFERAKNRLVPAKLQCPANSRHQLELQRGINWDMLVNGIATE